MENKLKETKFSLEVKINDLITTNTKLENDQHELRNSFKNMSSIITELKSQIPKSTSQVSNFSNLYNAKSECNLNIKHHENSNHLTAPYKNIENEESNKCKMSHSVENLHINENLSSININRPTNKEDLPADEDSINMLPSTPNCVKKQSKFMKNRTSCIETKDEFMEADMEVSIDEVGDPNSRKIYTNKPNMFKDFQQRRRYKNMKMKPRIETIRLDYDTIEQSKVLKTEESDIPEMMKMFDIQKNTSTIKANHSLNLNENSPECSIKVVTMYPKLLANQSRSSSENRLIQNRKNSTECGIRMKMLTNYKDKRAERKKNKSLSRSKRI